MRTLLSDHKEIEAALRAPRASVYCVGPNLEICRIDQVRRKRGEIQLRLWGGNWTRQFISVYREV